MSKFQISDLQEMLVETLNKVSKGTLTPAAANAAANLVGKYVSLVKTEIDYNKLQGVSPNLDFFPSKRSKANLISQVTGKTKQIDHDSSTGELLNS